jgi:hypothetical protein
VGLRARGPRAVLDSGILFGEFKACKQKLCLLLQRSNSQPLVNFLVWVLRLKEAHGVDTGYGDDQPWGHVGAGSGS